MPVELVFDHPHGQTTSAFMRLVRALAGAVLVFVGLLATIVAVPTGFVAVADIVMTIAEEPEPVFPADFPLREIEAAFAAAVIGAFIGLRYGRRLVRGTRTPVLFLRRFGYRGSMQAVTFALTNTIGPGWRLVTLDDAAIAPVGVPSLSRLVFRAGEAIARAAAAAGRGILVGFQWIVSAMWATVALQVIVVAPDWERLLRDGIADRYVAIASTVMDGRVPTAYFTPTLSGLFAVCVTGVAIGLGGLLLMMVVLLSTFPLFGVLILATSSAEALRKAEESKTRVVTEARDVQRVAAAIAHQARQTFAPRLVVLRVATPIWQQTVTALTNVSAVSIIDVSEPTENLVWELWELERLRPHRYVLIGEHARLAKWADVAATPPVADSLEARFAARLASRRVLAYSTDQAGMRRFAHALHGMLLDAADGLER